MRIAAAALLALALAPAAHASFIVDRDAAGVSVRVSGSGAIVNWTSRGARRNAVLSGAVNGRPPTAGVAQVAFRVRYGYGPARGGSCGAYDGPPLPLLVAACKAPDGSYWAIQRWQRLAANYGGRSAPAELHASHWRGDLPKLEVWLDWSYGRYQHLFGRFTYLGKPVFGFHSTGTGSPLDAYGRNLYLDTLDSAYGPGWRRENSFLAHRGTGVFCYGFYRHGSHPVGVGSMYRLLVQGPGVTPIVSWAGQAPGAFDRTIDAQMNQLQLSLGDRLCRQS